MSFNQYLWFVSRQTYCAYGENYVVEVAQGGRDYANPDMLVEKYPGEGEEYHDPREAAKNAIEIAKRWRADDPDKIITVRVGFTSGMTLPFDEGTDEQTSAWGEQTFTAMPKCPNCGKLMGTDRWTPTDFHVPPEEGCCSERCANEHFAFEEEEV